ncbi:MAG: phosphoribosylglycinamide formyltransferase [Ignavibacteria bacterium]|jgi:phosphoribosylglycinamide formyltransferase-1|nr:phosphoribosylglycinamide formyltransferase [Ignavibacteria bacterium]
MPSLHLAFLASHSGSNVQSILNAIKKKLLDAKPCVIISNNSKAYVLERAKIENIPSYHISSLKYPEQEQRDSAIIEHLEKHNADTIVLAGYMKKLSSRVIEHFKGRVLNIHPALLPKYGGDSMYGMAVHQAVIDAKEIESGATVHLVNSEYDKGRILAQEIVPVFPDDSPEILAARVLAVEHQIYWRTLEKIAKGEIEI